MQLWVVALPVAIYLLIAYRFYGNFLSRLLKLDDREATPANYLSDGNDFVPTPKKLLIGQHFSAIAAAGPIVGPILAGKMFGWGPALLWILFGSVFVGGVHDLTTLVASVRHKGRSIAELVQEYLSRRSYIIFLLFIWFTLVYIIVAFTDITAQAFVGVQVLESGERVSGAGIATSSLLYLILPIFMGLLLRYTKIGLNALTAIFVPLVLFVIWWGQKIPLDISAWFGISDALAQRYWGVAILSYCLVAGVLPVWLLLQPRGHLGGYFLYLFLIIGVFGVMVGGFSVNYPAFISIASGKGESLFPYLFITIACGAVSGFHSLVASGTTSKQLLKESDAKPIGYGAMILEAGVAFLALSSLMMLSLDSSLVSSAPNLIFASGIAGVLKKLGVSEVFAISLMLMAFTTFVYDTLDVCARLGRYIVQEVTGLNNAIGAWLGAAITSLAPLAFIFQGSIDSHGNTVPVWRTFWPLFGASNQLLAALALAFVAVWLIKTSGRSRILIFSVVGLPSLLMFVMSIWSTVDTIRKSWLLEGTTAIQAVSTLLLILCALILLEVISVLRKGRCIRTSAHGNTTATC